LERKTATEIKFGCSSWGFILGESPLFSIVGFGIQSWPYVYKMKHSEPSKTAITLEVMDNE